MRPSVNVTSSHTCFCLSQPAFCKEGLMYLKQISRSDKDFLFIGRLIHQNLVLKTVFPKLRNYFIGKNTNPVNRPRKLKTNAHSGRGNSAITPMRIAKNPILKKVFILLR